MQHIKLKNLLKENKSNYWMQEALEEDLAFLQEKLIEEGLWDTIKQKVGGALDKTSEKAKQLLLKPLVKVIMDKVAKDDPQGFAQLQQYAAKDPQNITKLMDHPDIKKQSDKINVELQSIKESLDEAKSDDFIQEYIDAVLEEAKVLKTDPKNVARRQRYAQRKAARLSGQTPNKKEDPKKEPSAGDDIKSGAKNIFRGAMSPYYGDDAIKKGAKELGKGVAKGADKLGIAAIEKGGDAVVWTKDKIKQGMDTETGKAVSGAVGGLISKVYGWVKKHPKITASVALGLLGAIFTAAGIGSGGVIPLVLGTIGAGGFAAVKGGVIGTAVGGGKEMYNQIKGGATSFKDLDLKKVAAAAKTGLFKGGKYGFIIGAGLHVAGQALAGISKMAASTAKITGDNTLIDKTIDKQEWVTNPKYTIKGQFNMVIDSDGNITKFRVPKSVFDEVMRSYGIDPTHPSPADIDKHFRAAHELFARYQSGEFLKQAASAAGEVAQAKATAASAAAEVFKPVSGQEVDQVYNAIINGGVKELNIHGHSFLDILKANTSSANVDDYKFIWQSLKMQIKYGLDDPRLAPAAIESVKTILDNGLSNLAAK